MFWILATLLIALASLFPLVPLFKPDLSDPPKRPGCDSATRPARCAPCRRAQRDRIHRA